MFTHVFLKSLNDQFGCLEVGDKPKKTPSVNVVGRGVIAAFDSFDLKAFQHFLGDLQKRRTMAQLALERERARSLQPKKPAEDSDGEAEEEAEEPPEEEEPEESAEEGEEDLDIETNTRRIAQASHPAEGLLCRLLADFESASELSRSERVFGVSAGGGRPRRLRLLIH